MDHSLTDQTLTDVGNAARFVELFGDFLRFVPEHRRWLFWDGSCWTPSKTKPIECAKLVAQSIYVEAAAVAAGARSRSTAAELASWAKRSQAKERIKAMVELASSDDRVVASTADFDQHPLLIVCGNGTYDLLADEFREARQSEMMTRSTRLDYDPGAQCPRFEQHVRWAMGDDSEMIEFLQMALGYSLTGDVMERKLFVMHGSGSNGKGTIVESVKKAMGDYAQRAPNEMIVNRKSGIPNDVARTDGVRFLFANETAQGAKLSAAFVKEMTGGGDTLTARFMRGEWFDFVPQFKLWLSTNHKPQVSSEDEALWDRLRLIPFEQRVEAKDKDLSLADTLAEERAGILRWLIDGARKWVAAKSLPAPEKVRIATQEYRDEMDTFADFIAERCLVIDVDEEGRPVRGRASTLHTAYTSWAKTSGAPPLRTNDFKAKLTEHGHNPGHDKLGSYYEGIDVVHPSWADLMATAELPTAADEAAQLAN